MVRLLGHRQTKGTATDNDEPQATAPHLDSTEEVNSHFGRWNETVGRKHLWNGMLGGVAIFNLG